MINLKSKNKKILLILSTLFILGVVGLLKWNKDFLLLWNANNIYVQAEKPLNKEKIKIKFGFSSLKRETDEELFIDFEKDWSVIIFDNGNLKNEMPNEYGENDFLITYDDKYYLSFRQFKLNRRHQHDYYFKFYEKHNHVFVKINIKGQDGMRLEKQLLEISQADKYRYNILIEYSK